MKPTPIILIFLFITGKILLAQNISFQEKFSIGEAPASGEAITQTNDNGFAIAGEATIDGNAESFLSKFGSDGSIQWTKIYFDNQSHIISNGQNDTEILCNAYLKFLLVTYDNGFILGGGIDSSVFITYPNGVTVGSDFFRMFVIKTDEDGNLLWSKKYSLNDFDGAAAIVEDPQHNGYYVAGYAHQTGSVVTDDLFIRLDNDGNILWTKSFGGTGSEGASDMKITSDGNFIVCGTSESFSNNQNIYVVKMDTSGNTMWSKTYGTSGFDYGKSVLQSQDGGYYIYGNAGNGSPSYITLIKTDSSGNLIWSNTYGNYLLDGPTQLQYATDGSLVALVDHYTGQHDGLIIHIDTAGNPIGNRNFGNPGANKNDFLNAMLPVQSNYFFAGSTNSYSSNQYVFNGYLIHTDATLFSACNADSINSNATPVSLTVAEAATSVAEVSMNAHEMYVTEMDSDFIADTLCSSVFTGITESSESVSSFSIFPNPASDKITVSSKKPFTSIKIYNEVGEEMKKKEIELTKIISLDISDLQEGIYFISVLSPEGFYLHQSIIIR